MTIPELQAHLKCVLTPGQKQKPGRCIRSGPGSESVQPAGL